MISVILAAGKGTRMKSEQSKVLHKVNGVPMIRRVVTVLENIGNKKNVFILGHKKEDVLAEMGDVDFVTQEEQLGTGHAILIAKDKIKEYGEDVLITYGDTPLLKEGEKYDFGNNYTCSSFSYCIFTFTCIYKQIFSTYSDCQTNGFKWRSRA